MQKSKFFQKSSFALMIYLLFIVVFYCIYYFIVRPDAIQTVPFYKLGEITTKFMINEKTLGLIGVVFGLLVLIINGILNLVRKIIFGKRAIGLLPILTAISYLPIGYLGFWLMNKEPRRTDLQVFLIEHLGNTIRISFLVIIGICFLRFLTILFMKSTIKATKTTILIFFIVSTFLVSGCDSVLEGIGKLTCKYAPDSDHCFQWSAINGGNPDICEKIKGTKFKDIGSNPPRDKCYLQIAINKGDPNPCYKIKGGMMSYTQSECFESSSKKILNDAISQDNITNCDKLKKFPNGESQAKNCKGQLANIGKVKDIDSKIENLIQKMKSDGKSSANSKELAKLEKERQNRFDNMSDGEKTKYIKEKREQIMEGIEDDDVKSAISKEYTARRGANSDGNLNKMLEKMKEITEQNKKAKELDEIANEMMDNVKNQMLDYVNSKKDEAVDELIGAGAKAGEEWIKKNGGDNLKYALSNLKRMAEKYDKASKEYENIMGKYNKIKEKYDEIMGVYKKIDEINDLVAKGKIDEGKANVIKGAILLDKGLEHATKYVPVFGSTISKISKETFGVVIDLSKKRAKRSTSLDKCFADPANCDTDEISGY